MRNNKYAARLQVEGSTGRKFWTIEINKSAMPYDFGDNRRLAENMADQLTQAYAWGRAHLLQNFHTLMHISTPVPHADDLISDDAQRFK